MIANKTEHRACYKALQQLDEIERQLRGINGILRSLGTSDIYEALRVLSSRRQNILLAIKGYIDIAAECVDVPDLDSALASVRHFVPTEREESGPVSHRHFVSPNNNSPAKKYRMDGGDWNVSFTSFGEGQKIPTIKELRTAKPLGLKEAKDLVESASWENPSRVRNLSQADAEQLVQSLNSLGCNSRMHQDLCG